MEVEKENELQEEGRSKLKDKKMNCGLESTRGKVWNKPTKIAGPEEMEPERVDGKIGRTRKERRSMEGGGGGENQGRGKGE